MSEAEADRALLDRLYGAFQQKDGATMAACYHADAEFSDPVFVGLRGAEVGGMWRMLCERAKDFALDYDIRQAAGGRGVVAWQARYLFSATGRPVVNRIVSTLELDGGLVRRQRDDFDLRRWAVQALGWKGNLVATLPPLRAALRGKAKQGLADYLAAAPAPS
jgi:ketosteroid isomerase-like protein